MSDAINHPVKRTYNRKEVVSTDFDIGQKSDIDLSLDVPIVHGESIVNVAGDVTNNSELMAALKFNEEPVTIMINENSRSDFPEPFVPVSVNGKGAEIFNNGRWVEVGWLAIGTPITTKRKYVELLLRSKSDSIRTVHDDATVERPRNSLNRKTSANYPVSIIEDKNPLGSEWASRLMMNH